MLRRLASVFREESGASLVEYAILVLMIAIVALVAVQLTGTSVSSMWVEIGDSF